MELIIPSEKSISVYLVAIIIDDYHKIELCVDRLLFCIKFPKFINHLKSDSMFLEIKTKHAHTMRDIISSIIYGTQENEFCFPLWKYILEKIYCLTELGINFDHKLLYHVEIPSEYFDLLLDICKRIDMSEEMVETLFRNAPDGYQLDSLIDSKSRNSCIIMISTDNSICKYMFQDDKILYLPGQKYEAILLYSLPYNRILMSDGNSLIVVSLINGYSFSIVTKNIQCLEYLFYPNLIIVGSDNHIEIRDGNSYHLVKHIKLDSPVKQIKTSIHGSQFIVISDDSILSVYNSSGILMHQYQIHNVVIEGVCYIDHNEVMIASDDGSLRLVNLENGKSYDCVSINSIVSIPNFSIQNIHYSHQKILIQTSYHIFYLYHLVSNTFKKFYDSYDLRDVQFLERGDRIISLNSSNCVKIWDRETARILYEFDIRAKKILWYY